MKIVFPSAEFDDAVAAVCHGTVSDEHAKALNTLLLTNASARDEYLLRLELHSYLGSNPDLFSTLHDASLVSASSDDGLSLKEEVHSRKWHLLWGSLAVAAVIIVLLSVDRWGIQVMPPAVVPETAERTEQGIHGVAMLSQVVDAEWVPGSEIPSLGTPLEPGLLRLESGLAQITFFSGARVVIQGPTELELISQNEASCFSGQLTAEVPPQAQGFRIVSPQARVTDLGTSFGMLVNQGRTDVHVFSGAVALQSTSEAVERNLREGEAMVIEESSEPRSLVASSTLFAPLFYMESQSLAADAERYAQWKESSSSLNQDSSLLLHLDFEGCAMSGWRLHNAGYPRPGVPDASIVGCTWGKGRWPEKAALEFRGVSDRVRLIVPGEHDSLTLAAWVRVQGLDRQINSLVMSDGFEPGTVHWSIRNDGVLGFTVIGEGRGNFQILASPPVIKLDQFGMWVHLAVVLDGVENRVVHYLDGQAVSETALRIKPPYRIGAAELGNWNPSGFPGKDRFLVRNFSGAIDEITLFSRALESAEISALYDNGKP